MAEIESFDLEYIFCQQLNSNEKIHSLIGINVARADLLGTATLDTKPNPAQTPVSNTSLSASSSKNAEDVEIFIKLVFSDFDLRDISFLLGKRKNGRSQLSKLVLYFQKRMFLLSFSFRAMHEKALEEFIADVSISREHIFTLLSCHCFEICSRFPNIFITFIYTCCFVYAASQFFKERDRPDFEKLAPMCAHEIYKFRIKDELEALGGLEALFSYIESRNVVDMIDFMRFMHTSIDASTTDILLRSRIYRFGVRDATCHEELIINIGLIVDYTKKLFPVEMTNKVSLKQIRKAFSNLEVEVKSSMDLDENKLKHLKRQRNKKATEDEILRKEVEKILGFKHGSLFRRNNYQM